MSDKSDQKPDNTKRKQLGLLLLAFFLGAFWLFAIRFVTIQKKEVHYHANFAVFVDGERLPFDNFLLYEEVQSCFDGEGAVPQSRGHMHDRVNHIVHVHDHAVTWGHFFANLGMVNGDSVFKTDSALYSEETGSQINFLLNGENVATTANRIISSEDVLLVSIGENSQSELAQQYDQIQKDAAEYNNKNDPSNCSGGKPFTFLERFKAALGVE